MPKQMFCHFDKPEEFFDMLIRENREPYCWGDHTLVMRLVVDVRVYYQVFQVTWDVILETSCSEIESEALEKKFSKFNDLAKIKMPTKFNVFQICDGEFTVK